MPRFSIVHWVPKLLIYMFFLHTPLQVYDSQGAARTPFELHDRRAVVLIFVAIDCPISNSYAPEINRIVSDYAKQNIDFYIVYSDPKLTVNDAKKHDADFSYICPSLMDTQQSLLKRAKVTVTPQAVVFKRQGEVLYSGRIDNWYEAFGRQRYSATSHDLRNALDDIIAGKKVAVPVTKAIGCPV